jgi:hypothetical protein
VPRRILPPFLKVRIGAFRQIVSPCRFERRARRFKGRRGAVALLSRVAPWIKSAMPFPRLRYPRDARSLDDHADASIVECQVTGRSLTRLRVSWDMKR